MFPEDYLTEMSKHDTYVDALFLNGKGGFDVAEFLEFDNGEFYTVSYCTFIIIIKFNGILFFFSLYVIVSGESLRGIHYIHLLYCTIELERRETKYCRILFQSEF